MAEAGWYDDPSEPGQKRYFDGTVWTDHIHRPDVVPPPPPTSEPASAPAADTPSAPPSRSRRPLLIAAGVVVVALVVILVIAGGGGSDHPDMGEMANKAFEDTSVIVRDEAEDSVSLLLIGGFDEETDTAMRAFLDELGFSPTAVMSRIGNTRALDGTQTATGEGVQASWTYHPDNGLQMVLEATRA